MRRSLVAMGLLVAVVVGLPGSAGADPSGELRIESVDTAGYPDITTTVVAPRRLADTDLDGRHFTAVENGRVHSVVAERVTTQTQQIVLVLDTSGSMRGRPLAGAKAAAREFLAATPDGARVAVVGFATAPTVVQRFTSDRDAVLAAVDALEAGGHTTLYDGIIAGTELLGGDRHAPRAVVVLSDGADTNSVATLDQAAAAVAETLAGFYAVELVDAGSDRVALQHLADGTGGAVASAAEPEALSEIYTAFGIDVSNRYQLRYRSGAYGGAKLTIALEGAGVHEAVSTGLVLPPPPAWRRVLQSPLGLAAGAAATFLALTLLVLAITGAGRPRAGHAGLRRGRAQQASAISGLAGRASALAESTLAHRGWSAALERALDRAGLTVRPGEFLVIATGAALAAVALGTVVSGLPVGLLLGGVTAFGAKLFLSLRASRRRSQFADQLDDTLQLLAGSLRAGHSLLQALDAVSKEAEAPARDEFRQVVRETRIGRDLSAALRDAATRMASEDFEWIVQAVAIHREVGGDLASILDTAAGTIRERGQLRRQVKALSAEGRLSGFVLMALPVGLVGFMSMTNPTYIGLLTRHPLGWGMTAMAVVLTTVGGLWLRKLVRISF